MRKLREMEGKRRGRSKDEKEKLSKSRGCNKYGSGGCI